MIIYNLFPLLAGKLSEWTPHLDRAKDLGFDWVFVNPIQQPGGSGSLYATADYFKVNPLILEPASGASGEQQVRDMTAEAKSRGLSMMIDLVINHCADDSELLKKHPQWFKWEGGQVAHPWADENGTKVVWGDLAQFDHVHTADPEGLKKYFFRIVDWLLDLGFTGFRCDAAYQVPHNLWRTIISQTKARRPDAVFVAETLGCTADQTRETAMAGFDAVFNSSKWWDFHGHWLMAQYNLIRHIAPSISFPESHDTERLAQELDGNAAGLRQRYLFSALFSSSVMMPIGYEFGFRKKLHVVQTRPSDWEKTTIDISDYVRTVNGIKAQHRVFQEETPTSILNYENPNILVMWKGSTSTKEEALFILNKDPHNYQHFHTDSLQRFVQSGAPLSDISPDNPLDYLHKPFDYGLRPGEGRVLVTKR